MAILESLATFIISLFCLGSCYSINRKFYEQEAEIERLENACPPQYVEESAPPYTNEIGPNEIGPNEMAINEIGPNEIGPNEIGPNDMDTNELTPILPPPIDLYPN
jgi:hypothetical protein